MKKFFRKTLIYLIIAMLAVPTWTVTGLLRAESAKASKNNDNIVISEVQIAGNTPNDEFVELYNPTENAIDLTGWKLVKEASITGNPSNLVTSLVGSIQSHGYYLTAGSEFDGAVMPDAEFSSSTVLAKDNAVILFSDLGVSVDEVGMGAAVHYEGTAATVNPSASQSIERKVDNQAGNYVDTDDNSKDFYLQDLPNPQSSTSVDSTDLFTRIAEETRIDLDPTSITTVKTAEQLDLKLSVNYPVDLVKQASPEYKIDASITSETLIPAGTKLDLYYNSIYLGKSYEFASDLPANTPIWLSNIVRRIDPSHQRGLLNAEPETAEWEIKTPNLSDGIYNLSFEAVTSKDDFASTTTNYVLGSAPVSVIVDSSVSDPTNVLATRNGNDIKITWDAVIDLLSGIEGYDVYSSTDNFVTPGVKLNDSLVLVNNFTYSSPVNGKYTFKVVASDIAGNSSNLSEASNEIVIRESTVTSPKIKTTVSGRTINVSWTKVTGAVKYFVYSQPKSNGIITSTNHGNPYNAKDSTTYSLSVSDYGEYYVTVTAVDADDNESPFLSESLGQKLVLVPYPVTAAPAVVTPVVETTPAPVATVAPPKAVAEETTPTTTDDNGIIKGDENTDTESDNKINWTPWIVLFCLIILAGAATGGYFYWFNGEEEVSAVVRETKKETTAPKQTKEKVEPKNVKNNKKSKRW